MNLKEKLSELESWNASTTVEKINLAERFLKSQDKFNQVLDNIQKIIDQNNLKVRSWSNVENHDLTAEIVIYGNLNEDTISKIKETIKGYEEVCLSLSESDLTGVIIRLRKCAF